MPRLRTVSLLAGCAASALLRAEPVAAQAGSRTDETPRVNRVVIRGVHGVNVKDLRAGLATQPTRCRSVFLQPFCWVTRAGAFVEKHDLDPAELPRDELRIRVFLWRRGWRHSTVTTRVTPRGNGVAVTFDVDQGPATRVRSVTVRQTTPVLGTRQIRAAALPDTGDPLNVLRFDSATTRLLTTLWERGYGDATVRDTAVLTDTLAALEVTLDPGRRTTVARIEVEGNERVTDRTIRDALPIRAGQLFRRGRVEESQRVLYLTGMFRQALVSVPPTQDTAKTVAVAVQEAPFRLVRTQVGLTTVDYVQTQVQFTHYNWLGGGRRLDLTGVLGRLLASQLNGSFIFREDDPSAFPGVDGDAFLRPTWQASAQVTQPAFPASGNSLAIGVFTRRRVEPSVVVDRGFGGNLTFTHNLADRAPLSLVYRYEMNTVLAGDVYFCVNYGVCDDPTIQALQGRQSLSPVVVTGFVERVDDALMRNSGYTARLALEHASGLTASDFRYHRAEAELTRDLRLGRGTLAGRVHAGWVRGLSGTAEAVGVEEAEVGTILHPTTRFYAGGARSVRGYAENQLGPRILTVDPELLVGEPDSPSPAPCTPASLASGECDPNPVPSSEFLPRPVGGTRVVEASIEYRRPVWRNFVGAVFVDAARVSDPALSELAEARTAVTPGFGVRYRSPVGPIRVDLGIRPRVREELAVVTQVTEGGINRLVRLNVKKRYDPLEESGGFLRQLSNRLSLHLSIGEAF
ncbi:MAG TPA: BamA/TamA family outer membrane protein [Longimicrobiaceae bacterium]|nr:BamA/TamA family outer membrane protein [Longimicrobiaceae bacterium]